MAGVDNALLLDLLATTLKDLPKQQFEVAWDLQVHEFCRIYSQDRVLVDGGTSIQRNIQLDESGNAHYRKLFDTDSPGVTNVQHQIDIPWCQVGTNYSWEALEVIRQRNSVKGYINLLRGRRIDGMWSLANILERRGWLTPTTATDNLYPMGVPYYINMLNAGITAPGFSGMTIRFQGGTTGTVCAGIDAATETKWRNYAAVYVNLDNEWVRVMRRAFLATRFRPPVLIKDAPGQDDPGKQVRLYCGLDELVEIQDLADKRDDSMSPKDIAGKNLVDVDGAVYFNRRPFIYIPQLDSDDYDPIYCVDFGKFQPIVQDGYWLEESKPFNDRVQHTTFTVYLDGSHNNLCINRRTVGFVVHKVTA